MRIKIKKNKKKNKKKKQIQSELSQKGCAMVELMSDLCPQILFLNLNVDKVEELTDRLWTSHNEITGFQQPVIESKFPGLTLIPTRMWTKQETHELLSMSLTIYCGWLAYMNLNGHNLE